MVRGSNGTCSVLLSGQRATHESDNELTKSTPGTELRVSDKVVRESPTRRGWSICMLYLVCCVLGSRGENFICCEEIFTPGKELKRERRVQRVCTPFVVGHVGM